jgi:outer membrane protein assembly factor BamD
VTVRTEILRLCHAARAGALALLIAGCAASTLPSVHSESERLAVAQRLAAKRDFADAIQLLKTYITNNVGSADVDHAVYLLGQCYLDSREYASAAVEFERLLREFPESDSSGSAAFQLGAAYFGQSRPPDFDQEFTVKAVSQWRQYQQSYPGHWLGPESEHRIQIARMRMATKWLNDANLYVKLRDLGPARAYYRRVEDEYGDLPQLADAWVGLARCDVLEKKPTAAIQRLREVESRFAGRPIAVVAARELARLTN